MYALKKHCPTKTLTHSSCKAQPLACVGKTNDDEPEFGGRAPFKGVDCSLRGQSNWSRLSQPTVKESPYPACRHRVSEKSLKVTIGRLAGPG
jgi:hypothetical protein